jgi:hypothetical protein
MSYWGVRKAGCGSLVRIRRMGWLPQGFIVVLVLVVVLVLEGAWLFLQCSAYGDGAIQRKLSIIDWPNSFSERTAQGLEARCRTNSRTRTRTRTKSPGS